MSTLTHAPADLTACDREAIHAPGHVQPHGVLLALSEPALAVVQASANAADCFARPLSAVLGASVDALFGPDDAAGLREGLSGPWLAGQPLYLRTVNTADGPCHALSHRHDGILLLELERTGRPGEVSFAALDPLVRTFLERLRSPDSASELLTVVADEVRAMTGFDRVLVYQFDAGWNGGVVAESRAGRLPSYLGLHFPASDIPAQARELYRRNRIRLIPDGGAVPVPVVPELHPETGLHLDLSFAALRSVSPVHREYMRNMGTAASMSVSLLRDGRLWGLISCHHPEPMTVPFAVRTACDLIAQFVSLQLGALEQRQQFGRRLTAGEVHARLLSHMALVGHFADGLVAGATDLLALTGAGGAAVLYEGRCSLVGRTPGEEFVRRLADWLFDRDGPDLFHTDSLAEHWPAAASRADTAAGLLAASVSRVYRSFVLWFRPEVERTVTWAGDPRGKACGDDMRLHPRRSFEAWKQTVRGRSLPWHATEVDAAAGLRHHIVDIVLRKAEELGQLAAELRRINDELEAFSYSVSHDLRAPFRHIVGYSELLLTEEADQLSDTGRHYLKCVQEAGTHAGTLVDHLLNFARMSRTSLDPSDVDLGELVRRAWAEVLASEGAGRTVDFRCGDLPRVRADLTLLRLVVRNLLSNALKYTRPRGDAAQVVVTAEEADREVVMAVRDNGAGFDMAYSDKLFGAFQRLHLAEEFEGTGVGLATVRRIVARHGGRVWCDAAVDRGATFYVALPRPARR